MGAVRRPFPSPPNHMDSCEDEYTHNLIFHDNLDLDWSTSDGHESVYQAISRIHLDSSREQPFRQDSEMEPCMKASQYCSSIDAPRAWQTEPTDWHLRDCSPSQLPYALEIPSNPSARSLWTPPLEPDNSCSGGGSWSPHTTDSRSEAGGMFSQQLSPWESQRPSLTYIPLGGLSEYAPNGSYHGSAAATVISPQELQQYRDDCVEAPSPRPELHGIGTAHTFYSEGTGLLPGQGGPDHFVPHDEGLGPSIQNSRRVSIKAEEDMDDENDAEYDDDTGVDVDWSPGVENYGRGRRMPRRSTMSKIPATPTSKRSQRPPKVTAYHSGKPTKIMKKAPKASQSTAANSKNVLPCPHCSSAFPSDSTLKKHVLATHTRPFICTFHRYGCDSTVGSKNEWKRHINVQHMRLETWRCDIGACASVPNDPPPGRSHLSSQLPTPPVFGLSQDSPSDHHDFDRKDLFTQHMKRMHAPHNSASRADKQAFENGIDAAQMRCHLELRDAPSGIICPYCPDVTFESWDERIEHVGKHLEKEDIDTSREAEDFALREWMEQHGFIQWTRSAGWKLAETGKKKKRTPNIKLEEGLEDAEGEEE